MRSELAVLGRVHNLRRLEDQNSPLLAHHIRQATELEGPHSHPAAQRIGLQVLC